MENILFRLKIQRKKVVKSIVVDVIQYILLSVADAMDEGNIINSTSKKRSSNSAEKVLNDFSSTFMVEGYKSRLDIMEIDEYLYRKINPGGF